MENKKLSKKTIIMTVLVLIINTVIILFLGYKEKKDNNIWQEKIEYTTWVDLGKKENFSKLDLKEEEHIEKKIPSCQSGVVLKDIKPIKIDDVVQKCRKIQNREKGKLRTWLWWWPAPSYLFYQWKLLGYKDTSTQKNPLCYVENNWGSDEDNGMYIIDKYNSSYNGDLKIIIEILDKGLLKEWLLAEYVSVVYDPYLVYWNGYRDDIEEPWIDSENNFVIPGLRNERDFVYIVNNTVFDFWSASFWTHIQDYDGVNNWEFEYPIYSSWYFDDITNDTMHVRRMVDGKVDRNVEPKDFDGSTVFSNVYTYTTEYCEVPLGEKLKRKLEKKLKRKYKS